MSRLPKPKIDVEYPHVTIHRLAFGSCHRNKAVKISPQQPIIWDAISSLQPDAFLWTGDAIYTSQKTGISPISLLQYEYDQMLNNETLGYKTFLEKANGGKSSSSSSFLKGGVHGTWDDHDYGGNDYGMEMPERQERQNLFLDFLNVANGETNQEQEQRRRRRKGVYYAVTFGKVPQKVKVIFLDTRSSRSLHCIPSVGAMPLPFGLGSVVSCITRWISAGLKLQEYIPKCKDGKVLDEIQWQWLEEQLLGTDAQINIVVSSIQVLTTNPLFETWGQFPQERNRLLGLLNLVPENKSVVLLSGDVHHGEILDSSVGVKKSMGRTIEVTSSGLTHSCTDPFYGSLCEPILNKWSKHRYRNGYERNYFTGKNFGSIDIHWDGKDGTTTSSSSEMKITIHNNVGKPILGTGSLPLWAYESHFTSEQIANVLGPVDGHMIPLLIRILFALLLLGTSLFLRRNVFAKVLNGGAVGKGGKEKQH
mmetsp:Transcript_12103/g.22651  ORF Transcript_12103/g.22651 Transcript_12103/m.22651 type:complete len:478 (+) Transcript_12103:66-1499(+)